MSRAATQGRATRRWPVRLLALASTPGYYHTPLFRALAADPRVSLKVLYQSTVGARAHDPGFGKDIVWDLDQLTGYDHDFVDDAERNDPRGGFLQLRSGSAARFIRQGGFDALWVHGYASLSTWRAAAAARSRGMAVLVREEQTLLHGRPLMRRLPRALALRAFLRGTHALWVSSNNRDFFRRYGVPEERLWFTPYSVDNERLSAAHRALKTHRAELRKGFGVDDDRPLVLFVGKLIPKKQPLRLLEAFRRVRRDSSCALVFVGDGALRAELEAAASDVPDVFLAGFVNQHDLPGAYVAADAFVLPSAFHETFGLVVAEAMNFELPVIASDRVGCARDLVRDGENGYVFNHASTTDLTESLARLVNDAELRTRFGRRSAELVRGWNYDIAADGIASAAVAAVEAARC